MYNSRLNFNNYIFLMAVLALLAFIFNLAPVVLALFLLVIAYIIKFNFSPWYTLVLLFLAPLTTPNVQVDDVFMIGFYIIAAIVLLYDAFKQKRFVRLGKLAIPLILFLDVSIIGLFVARQWIDALEGALLMGIVLLAYVYFVNVIRYEKDMFERLTRLIIAVAILSTIQSILVALIEFRQIQAVIEQSVMSVYPHLIAIPLVVYHIRHSQARSFWIMVFFMLAGGIILSFSYARIFTLMMMVMFFVPYWFLRSTRKGKILAFVSITLVSSMIVSLIVPFYGVIIDQLSDRLIEYIEVQLAAMRVGLSTFTSNILLGTGGLRTTQQVMEEAGQALGTYQNIFLETASLGIIGLLAFLYLQVKKVTLLVRVERGLRYVLMVLFISTVFVGGLFEAVYYALPHLLLLFLVLATAEISAHYNKQAR